jgi:NADH dehydrogenase FAD-containing subunit
VLVEAPGDPGYADIYAIGDMAHFALTETPAGIALVAMQQVAWRD